MTKSELMNKKVVNFFYDHFILGASLKLTFEIIVSIASGILFAFGFSCFITGQDVTMVTGGVSGFCQNIVLILEMCGLNFSPSTLQSILYFVINVPILLFAFFKIGKQFALLSVVVVGFSSLFISIFTDAGVAASIQNVEFIKNSPLTRVLFAGLCTGVSSSIAFKIDVSSGGIDVLSYYMGMKKSSQIGKYGIIGNAGVVLLYFILLVIKSPANTSQNLVLVLYSLIYLVVVSLVIDLINIRNKKAQIMVNTDKQHMADTLITIFPHGATIMKTTGAFSGNEKETICMVVSTTEVNRVIKVVKKVDEHAFVIVTPVTRVYGNFFSRPVE